MIEKNNLLEMLRRSLKNEDEFILNYEKTLTDRVRETEGLSKGEQKEIIKFLGVLIEDTKRHQKTVTNLIQRVEKGSQDAF